MVGSPLRSWRQLRVPALVLGAACVLALAAPAEADTGVEYVTNGDFEDGLTGWFIPNGANAVVDTSVGGVDGPNALRIEPEVEARLKVETQWWLSPPVAPGADYRLTVAILDDDPGIGASLGVEFLDADGGLLHADGRVLEVVDDAPAFRSFSVTTAAPPEAAYVRAVVRVEASTEGATIAVDGASIRQVSEPPTVTPTVQPAPSPSGTATPGPSSTVTPTPTPTASVTPTPVVFPIGPSLRNATFDAGAEGWSASRGHLETTRLGGAAGAALVLVADGGSTAWVEQAVTVTPGGWYEASALLSPLHGVRAAWVRIAWYASGDASGAQMHTDDSEAISGGGAAVVSTGSVQAPAGARSAKVRILLQPAASSGGMLAVDNVIFVPAAPPPPPTPTPTATPSMTPTPLPATPSPSTPDTTAPNPMSPSTPAPAAPASPSSPRSFVDPGTAEGQSWIRITEVLPDPLEPGRDADHEWVELTNLGPETVDLVGMTLRDAQASTPLPALAVPPGASVVIAGALAEVDADARLEGSIGNGLGNDGDRLELLDATGRVVDAVEYGDGTDLRPEPGETVQRWFDADGHLLGAGVGVPTPGVHEVLAPEDEETVTPSGSSVGSSASGGSQPAAAVEAASDGADAMAWMLLLAIGGGALGGVVAQRLGR